MILLVIINNSLNEVNTLVAMCLLTFLYTQGNKDLIICSNRDENLVRPTLRGGLHALEGAERAEAYFPQDREAGGTWIALSNLNARFAVVLNFHDWRYPAEDFADCLAASSHQSGGPVQSRGLIVLEFIKAPADVTAKQFAHKILAKRYGSYSLLVGDSIDGCYYVSNRDSASPVFMTPGVVHSISNGKRSDVWPKMKISLNRVREVLAEHHWNLEGGSICGGDDQGRGRRSLAEARALARSLRAVFEDDTPQPDATYGDTRELYMKGAAIFVKPIWISDPKVALHGVNFGTRTTTIAVSVASSGAESSELSPTDVIDNASFTDVLITETDRDEISGLWSDTETVLPRFARTSD